MKTTSNINRRAFLRGASATIAGFSVAPGAILGLNGAASPNSKLNIACVGVGGRGAHNVNEVGGENIVALCDVDADHARPSLERFPKAQRFTDFRRMLDRLDREIDAVVVSTPDHTHGVAVTRALKQGKHVYCEKPLAHSIHEVREIRKAARESGRATQLGNQGHSFDSIRVFVEWIRDGAIGPVRKVDAMCGSNYSRIDQLDEVKRGAPVPNSLNWDLWLGPARERPYHPAYVPGSWRGWRPFGSGVIGDWTCHVVDPVFWALDLDAPETIEAHPVDWAPKKHGDTFPPGVQVHYRFPAKAGRPAVDLVWHDGDQKPARPEDMDDGDELPSIGALVAGDQGKILYGSHGASRVRVIAGGAKKDLSRQPQRLPKSPGHHEEWIAACKGGNPAGSNFDYGGPLTEVALLGIIAMQFPGQKLEWNAREGRFTNFDEANALVRPDFRAGWSL